VEREVHTHDTDARPHFVDVDVRSWVGKSFYARPLTHNTLPSNDTIQDARMRLDVL